MFREQSVEIYNDMVLHLNRKEYIFLGQLAHKAKSSVAIMGMDNLAAMLKNFEISSRDSREVELYPSWIERFKIETEAAGTELEHFVNTRKSDDKH
jgi:hypothetical protein